ncbi:hypothetical protein B0H10DRAFT_1940178 [Mycena sp. CBHHK59/15]|nr:hypothetical protein B0H10DRAFT_1940178 [Mycena sp. CBHHK59/15]
MYTPQQHWSQFQQFPCLSPPQNIEDYRHNELNLLDNRNSRFMGSYHDTPSSPLLFQDDMMQSPFQNPATNPQIAHMTLLINKQKDKLITLRVENVLLWCIILSTDLHVTSPYENGNYASKDRASALRKIVYKVAFAEAEKGHALASWGQASLELSKKMCSELEIVSVQWQLESRWHCDPALVSNTGTKCRPADSVPLRKKPKTVAPSGRCDRSQKKDRRAKIRLRNPLVGTSRISKGAEAVLPKPPPRPEAGERAPVSSSPAVTAPIVTQSPPVVATVAPLIAVDATPLVENRATLTPLTVAAPSAIPTPPDPKMPLEPISSLAAISTPSVPPSLLQGDPLLVLAQATSVAQLAPAVSAPTVSKMDPVPNLAPPQVVSTSGQKVWSLCGQLWKWDNPNGYTDEFNVYWKALPKGEKQKWKATLTGVECRAVGASAGQQGAVGASGSKHGAVGASVGQQEPAQGGRSKHREVGASVGQQGAAGASVGQWEQVQCSRGQQEQAQGSVHHWD